MFSFIWNDLLVNPMTNALILLSNVLFDSFGLSIIAFTLITRLVLYPLTLRQLRATRLMQEIQPRAQEIQKKYKDPRRRQEEMMKLYREVGFNPVGCAVPFLVQIPIWIALFQVVRRTLGTTPEALFGLSGRLYDWDYIINAIPLSRHFLLLDLSRPSPLLAVLVMAAAFVQQKLSSARSVARDDRQRSMNRTMMWAMPLMFGWFSLTVPSGLGLYWFITSLFGAVTAYFYVGPSNVQWRYFFSLDPMAVRPAALAAPSRTAPEPPAPAEPASQVPAATSSARRRRRRRQANQQNREA